jgi:FkbM family methyltransferase
MVQGENWPMSAAEQLTQGWKLHQAGDLAGAEGLYRAALAGEPNNATAWCYWGILRHDQKRYDEAERAYRRAVTLRPDFPIAHNNLGNTLSALERREEALESFDRALALQPEYANAFRNKGAALNWLGRLDEAVACFQRALELAPDDPQSHRDLGVVYLLQDRWEEGWREYAWRWKMPDTPLPRLRQPPWDGSSLDGKTIFLLAEQGMGDTVHFIRYAARLKQLYRCRVIASCHKPLLPLLQSVPGLDAAIPLGAEPNEYDVYAPLLSVPGMLGDVPDSFPAEVPYLRADEDRVAYWRDELVCYGGLRVGLVWQGNRDYEADRLRSAPLAAFEPLGRLKGVTLFSLQKGFGDEQLDGLAGRFPLVPLGRRLDNQGPPFFDTLAVIQSLDLVVTVDTVIAHLAGALGAPVWLALGYVCDWRWGQAGDRTIWYPTMRLFRQTVRRDWSTVFQPMARELLSQQAPRVASPRPEDFVVAAGGFNRLARTRQGLMLYNRNDVVAGRSLERYGELAPGEEELFRQIVRPGATVVEADAGFGVHTLRFSKLVGPEGAVHAFEPQRILFQTLCGNLALHSRTNVYCHHQALDEKEGTRFVPPIDYDREHRFSEITLAAGPPGEATAAAPLDRFALTACQFLRLDAAGREAAMLRGARETITRHRPVLYINCDRTEQRAELITLIQSLDYKLYWHTPAFYSPSNYYGNSENVFPRVVTANLLCVPAAAKADIRGLPEVTGPDSDWRPA